MKINMIALLFIISPYIAFSTTEELNLEGEVSNKTYGTGIGSEAKRLIDEVVADLGNRHNTLKNLFAYLETKDDKSFNTRVADLIKAYRKKNNNVLDGLEDICLILKDNPKRRAVFLQEMGKYSRNYKCY